MIFVDTGAWFATIVPSDPNHSAAKSWIDQNTLPLFTTDYIVDETLTLLRARGEGSRAIRLGDAFFGGSLAIVYKLTEGDLFEAWQTFKNYDDKGWSFTDCTSKVSMLIYLRFTE